MYNVPRGPKVKRARRYDSARRQAAAAQRRAAIVDAASRLFVRDGFSGTTIARIAADAGVSEETVYKAFGNKVALVRAIRDKALAGEGAVHAERRSDRLQASEHDPRAIIRGWGVLAMEVAPRVAPVLLLVRDAAASDAELARLQEEMDASRLTRMTHNARTLLKGGHLRDRDHPRCRGGCVVDLQLARALRAAGHPAGLVHRTVRTIRRRRDDCRAAAVLVAATF